ncbi:hypothetical protein CDD83_5687 [Cordyceps sp. RAO-2017]|nr:hypothetical protein CDD83_5687 [Cordyceps sp. RAO-2017]
MAERLSEEQFNKLASERGLDTLAKDKWKKSLSEVRETIGYKRLEPASPKLRLGGAKLGSSLKGAAAVAGVGLWVSDVVHAFTHDTSTWDKVEAVTAFLPFVSCLGQAGKAVSKGEISPDETVDTVLCFLGDALLLTPAWPLGVVVILIRTILGLVQPPELPTKEDMQLARDNGWRQFLHEKYYGFFYSHPHLYKGGGFRDKIETALAIEELAILSESAQTTAAASVAGELAAEESTSEENKTEIMNGIASILKGVDEATRREIARRKRHVLLKLPQKILSETELSIKPVAEEYNKNFTDDATSDKTMNKYLRLIYADPLGAAPGITNEDELRQRSQEIAQHLKQTPLSLPGLFELAFVIGQSRGLATLDNSTLSPQDFIMDSMPKTEGSDLSKVRDSIDTLALRHTLGVAQLLRGKRSEADLPTQFPTNEPDKAKELQLLICLKFGRLYDDRKIEWANELYGGPDGFAKYKDARIIKAVTLPDILPTSSNQDDASYMALIVGLSQAFVHCVTAELERDEQGASPSKVIFDALKRKAFELQKTVEELDLKQFVREAQESGQKGLKKADG